MISQRYPVQVRLIGVMQNKNNKRFMTSVLWSDQNDIIVYRKFEDFRKLHKQLQKQFLVEREFGRKSEGVLPKFEDVPNKRLRKKPHCKSMLRLKLLDKYFTALMELEPKISQCNDVIQFFIPQNQDLEPSFPKNSIVIMPSEVDQEVAEVMNKDTKRHSAGSITEPFVAETYMCVGSYETKDTKNRPFKVNVEETVDVLLKDPAGWWLVENEEKHIAWFPAPYLEKCCDPEYDDTTDGIPEEGIRYYSARAYEAKNMDELSLDIRVVVEVLQKSDNGWWLIRYNGKAGYVPSMYLQPYKNPHQKFQIQSMNLYRPGSPPGNLLAVKNLSCSQTSLEPCPVVKRKLLPLDRHKSRSLSFLSPPVVTINDHDAGSSAKLQSRMDSISDESEDSLNFSYSFRSSRDSAVSPKSDFLSGSQTDMAEQPQRSSNTPVVITHRRGSDCVDVAQQLPSRNSDPNLFKSSSMPKMPPRPNVREILSRCTTITKKTAMRLSPGSKPAVVQDR
ncbi:NADPH oxidase organizer 1-like isoform X1 [Acipenser ruthenus]|uniref:NADPH oxidase organizer 1-like isoform X1 n=1 Tax=Acipenser ruthenus TaxID=7906 RepID=UPI0027416161|nr:NADPH oxidase organizer 1-like isoform X1 [Acipenser ruthenus]